MSDDQKVLPCDVMLPPATRIGALEKAEAERDEAWRGVRVRDEAINETVKKLRADVARLRAVLTKIDNRRYGDRQTVSESNAWLAFQAANRELCAIYAEARDALASAPAAVEPATAPSNAEIAEAWLNGTLKVTSGGDATTPARSASVDAPTYGFNCRGERQP